MNRNQILQELTEMEKYNIISTRDGFLISVHRSGEWYSIGYAGMELTIDEAIRLLCLPQNILYWCLTMIKQTKIPIFELIGVGYTLLKGREHYE